MIDLAVVLHNPIPFKVDNVSETYEGPIKPRNSPTTFVAIIKDLPAKELFNELISYAFLTELNIPVPETFLGVVDADKIASAKGPLAAPNKRLVLASRKVSAPSFRVTALSKDNKLIDKFLDIIRSWPNLGDAYTVDAWLANTDRNPGNILVGGNQDVWLIDHGWALTRPNWKTGDLVPTEKYCNKFEVWLTDKLSAKQKMSCRRKTEQTETMIGKLKIEDVLEQYGSLCGLQKDEINMAAQFLNFRIKTAALNAQDALKLPKIA